MMPPISKESAYTSESQGESESLRSAGNLDGKTVTHEHEGGAWKLCTAGCVELFQCKIAEACSLFVLSCFGCCSKDD